MYSIERQNAILQLLVKQQRISVNDLADYFQVSKETIRRDIRQLEEQGSLTRTHGGIILPPEQAAQIPQNTANIAPLTEPPIEIRGMKNTETKRRLCQKAASFIQNGDNIYVDNSSTTLFLAEYLPANMRVTFLTNSIKFLVESAKINNPNITYICLGGIFKNSNLSTYGEITTHNASTYYPNKAFLSCTGVTAERDITDSSIEELSIKQHMIRNSKEVFLLADHSKFAQDGQVFLSPLSDIHYVITDTLNDFTDYSFLSAHNISVVVTDEPDHSF